MSSPVSVVIPCFNQGRYLGEALDSVQAQSVPAAEVLVVDDGSTDDTAEVAARYSGVRYVRQPNRGLAHARNRGFRVTASDFVVFLDADDRLKATALEIGLAAMAPRPECAFVYGHCVRIDADGRRLPTVPPPPVAGDHYTALLSSNYLWTPAVVMFRRAVCAPYMRFNPLFDASADYELYLRLTRRFPVFGHGELVAEYRLHEGSMSRDPRRMLACTVTVLRRERRYLQHERQRRAWRAGMRMFQSYYGEQVLRHIQRRAHDPRCWPQVARELTLLARYYPTGFVGRTARTVGRMLASNGKTRA